MWLRSGWRAAVISVLWVLWIGFASTASALTLADLNAGDMFTSGNGSLEFSFGADSVLVSGSLNSDLDNYEVVILDDGFRLVGPIGAADGNDGDILLDYSVSATNLLNPIFSAHLLFNGSAFGLESTANIAGELSNGDSLAVAVTGGGLSQKNDLALFAEPTETLAVVLKDIQVISFDVGQLASISLIDQRFAVIPEPGTAILLLSGLVGMAVTRRPRRRASRIRPFALLCTLVAALAADGVSAETTLADLVAGEEFSSQSGDLVFSDFAAQPVAGQVDDNLENYVVEVLENGFSIVPAEGSMDLVSGEVGTLTIDYRVTGGPGIEIDGASLSFVAVGCGCGSQANVAEDLFGDADMNDDLGSAGVFVTGGGGSQPSDDLSFEASIASLYAWTSITLDASAEGSASVNWIDQEFMLVPEPDTTLLGLTALASLAALRRLRAR
jgi:hypothetical protein